MQASIGKESQAFVLLAKKACLLALARASPSSAPAMIFFWFGQIMIHTFKAMMIPNVMPIIIIPVAAKGLIET